MKKRVTLTKVCTLAALLAVPFGSWADTVLFSDTFERADNTDIDAESGGMSGLAAPMTYFESDVQPVVNNENLTTITGGKLGMATGPNMSCVGLASYNFTNDVILTDGGFRVSLDMEKLLSAQTGLDNYCGFGVGISTSEVANLDRDFNTGFGPRGTWSGSNQGVADFYTCWTVNDGGDVQIFFGSYMGTGTQFTDVNVGDAEGVVHNLTADFYPDGFALGDNVLVYVYIDDMHVVTTNFTWSGENENCIGLSARINNGFLVDNLLVESFEPVPAVFSFASDPSVADITSSSEAVSLSWGADFMDPGATYTITANKAVIFPSGNTGSVANGLNSVAATVDGTLGDVEFTLVVDSGGTLLTNTTVVSAVHYAPALTSVLFSDTFDRTTTTNWNISASKTGVGGTIAGSLPSGGFWLETHQDANISDTTNWNDSCVIITTNASTETVCRMSISLASSVALDYNFIDAAILTDGGFSVAMDLSNWNGGPGRDYYCGFGVGLSHDEVMGLDDDASVGCARGSLTRAAGIMGVADLWAGVGHSGSGSFQIFSEGVLIDEIPLTGDTGNVRIDFGVNDFNAGSFVAYKVYFTDIKVGEGFFRWNNYNENYICVSSRIANGVDFDNVTVGTVDVPFTPPVLTVPTTATIDISDGFTNIVVTADAASNVVCRVDTRQDSLVYSTNDWQILTESPRSGGETVLNYDMNTNVTINVDATAYGWTDNAPEGYIRIRPVGWKMPVN